MGRPVTINGRELNFNDAPFIEANAEYSVTVDDDGTVVVERTDLKAENDKLRKLADAVKEFVEDSHCEDCPLRRDCYDNNRIFCANTFSHNAFAAMRKLVIEVE